MLDNRMIHENILTEPRSKLFPVLFKKFIESYYFDDLI